MFAIQKAYQQGSLCNSQWGNNILAGLVVGVVALHKAEHDLALHKVD